MIRCGAASPETGTICRLEEGIHLSHTDGKGEAWINTEATNDYARRPKRRETAKTKYRPNGSVPRPEPKTITDMKDAAGRATPETHVKPISTGVPLAAREAWSKDSWVEETSTTLHEFLSTHAGVDWTSPEDLWPLVDCPQQDMRVMSLVIQGALRKGWISEVGSRRLRGTYHTRDRVGFALNKLVPVYRSSL